MSDSLPRRPAMVTTVALFAVFASAIALLTGLSLVFPGSFLDRMWSLNPRAYAAFARMGRFSGALLLVLCVVAAATAGGLWRRQRWAWWLALATFGVNGLGDLASLFVTQEWLRAGSGVLIAAAFISLLLRGDVRNYFAQQP